MNLRLLAAFRGIVVVAIAPALAFACEGPPASPGGPVSIAPEGGAATNAGAVSEPSGQGDVSEGRAPTRTGAMSGASGQGDAAPTPLFEWQGVDASLPKEPGPVPAPPPECNAPTTAEVPYSDEAQLDGLILGHWIRCQGVIQPVGDTPAPDGQDALAFDLNDLPPDAALGAPHGSLMGVLASDAFDAGASPVLVYTGGGGYDSSAGWAFGVDDAGQPGVVFTLSHDGRSVIFDRARFSDSGNKMVLTDPMWNGTYVRVRP